MTIQKADKIVNMEGTNKHAEKRGYSDKLSKADRRAKKQVRKFNQNNDKYRF